MSAEPRAGTLGTAEPVPAAGFVLLASLTLFWGLNWPAMKIVLDEIPVWTFRSLCLLVGGGALLTLVALSRQPVRVPMGELRPMLVCAVFNVVGWHLCSGYGVQLLAAGRASIIAFTMPVWAVALGALVLGEALTRGKLLGLALGIAGLAVLIGPDLRALGAAPLGAAFMLGAAVSWAIGTILMKRQYWTMPVGALAAWQLIAGGVPVTLGAVAFEPIPDLGALSAGAVAAVLYVLALPMVFCHWAWFRVVRLFPAALAALGTLAIPVVGVLSSGLILGEPIGARELLALALVCAALGIVLLGPAWAQARARRAG